jgi:hypothetical protein
VCPEAGRGKTQGTGPGRHVEQSRAATHIDPAEDLLRQRDHERRRELVVPGCDTVPLIPRLA